MATTEPLTGMEEKAFLAPESRPRGALHLTRSKSSPRNLVLRCFLFLSAGFIFGAFLFKTSPVWRRFEWAPGPAGIHEDLYLLGVGKADITGPVVEINMMGYADPKQVGTGLRQRLYSRAFIVGDLNRPEDRFVYLVLDTQSGDTAIRYGIINALRELGPSYAVYGHHNVAVTGTHSHAGPGGWLNYLLPQITSKGFDHQGYKAIVNGTVESIRRAHESLQPGNLSFGKIKVHGANINRSLFAYLANPEDERARYNISKEDDGSVEKDLTLLKFYGASSKKNLGVLTWFPTHGTSLLGNNTLIAGDNKGVAAYLFEKSMREENPDFVAGFSQANVGDTSPNVLGAWCEDGSGQMCSFENSTCSDGKSQACHARGPFFRVPDNGASSCFEVGQRQFHAARALFDSLNASPGTAIKGSTVKSFHIFHDMSNFTFRLPNGSEARTCPAALGYSFAAGTSDGPGAFDFTQHSGNENTTSPVWKVVSHLLRDPSPEQQACHSPKPILLDVGEMVKPYAWTPNIVDVQAFRVGQLVIIVSPGEASTMAGRRWKKAVAGAFPSDTLSPVVVLGGPANSYTHYITTEEEYSIQRYEGASTLYGPHTLAAYINVTLEHLPCLSEGTRNPPREGDEELLPPDNTNRSLSFITGVVRDGKPFFREFGELVKDVDVAYPRDKGPKVSVTFTGANPRNNLRLGGTFAAVEKLRETSTRNLWRKERERLALGLERQFVATSKMIDEALENAIREGNEQSCCEGSDTENLDTLPWGNGLEKKLEELKEKYIMEEKRLEAAERALWGEEMSGEDEKWDVIRTDEDWSLVYNWRRTNELWGTSEVEIVWEVEDWAEEGVYRIRYFGDAKSISGKIHEFEGVSGRFMLL
ncbi:Neutral/alkaline nonlysosomal ceramidase [Cladorrhinum samala]|uniref:Neutral ceramidase n=1 Tax=Cladorrhinum samala TaxID=585594 RepID=A0AAV9HR17_9PEZI|nr:Neutral/alkaline nonlysosomal ceramidase [Cladorrhinum samala]